MLERKTAGNQEGNRGKPSPGRVKVSRVSQSEALAELSSRDVEVPGREEASEASSSLLRVVP